MRVLRCFGVVGESFPYGNSLRVTITPTHRCHDWSSFRPVEGFGCVFGRHETSSAVKLGLIAITTNGIFLKACLGIFLLMCVCAVYNMVECPPFRKTVFSASKCERQIQRTYYDKLRRLSSNTSYLGVREIWKDDVCISPHTYKKWAGYSQLPVCQIAS